ncbi:MAG: DHA2 family efflux MFS transporter permease subunit [Proteobacteria bacterium]|nr:DHA2 family efflux MFS transporter permease subunit [Pseudomonadota bacterium]
MLATFAVSLATFMNILDTTIANVSLPAIAGDFGVSPSQATWVITSYGVANAISVPLTGWLAQRFGQVRLFVISILLFILASFCCGLAQSMPMLIFFRVIQGFVAGPMNPLSQTLLLRSYPPSQAAMAMAAWGTTVMVGPIMGPPLGGWLTDNWSWPWIFYINIPVGLVAAWMTWSLLAKRESEKVRVPVDVVGLGLLVVWVAAMQFMLDNGRELNWFESPEIVTLAVVCGVGFVFFLVWELYETHPIVDLTLFAKRNFTVGMLANVIGFIPSYATIVLMPLWLQQYLGYSATWAGLVTAPMGLVTLVVSPMVARVMHRFDIRFLVSVSFALYGLAALGRAGFSTGVAPFDIIAPQLPHGLAIAIFMVSLTTLSFSGLPPERMAAASGLINFARIVASSFGTSLSTTLWDQRASFHHARLVDAITPYRQPAVEAMQGMSGIGLDPAQSLALMERTVNVQAYTLGVVDIFMLAALVYLALVFLIWFAKPEPAAA